MDEKRDLNKAQNLAISSIIGALVPLIGLVLAIIAIVISGGVPDNNRNHSKKNTIIVISLIGLALSFLAGFGYYKLYDNQQMQAAEKTRIQQMEYMQQQQREGEMQASLDSCLNSAYSSYLEMWDSDVKTLGRTDDTLPDANANRLDARHTELKEDCYKRYPVN